MTRAARLRLSLIAERLQIYAWQIRGSRATINTSSRSQQ
jgi:hypothetical protein